MDPIIVVAVKEIDGIYGTVGRAALCGHRDAPLLPRLGVVEFDAVDLEPDGDRRHA